MDREQIFIDNQRITNKEYAPKNELTFKIKKSSPATTPKTCSVAASALDHASSIKW